MKGKSLEETNPQEHDKLTQEVYTQDTMEILYEHASS